jgi:hypothetical protein
MEENKTTLGEARVRTEFNPSAEDVVTIIKNKSAELIDLVNQAPARDMNAAEEGEFFRLKALAMTAYEEAAMWAVKVVTK